MNAPFPLREARTSSATLQLFALFHLNLAFSSIEEEQRNDVIRRCYWPLLDLAQTHGPIGLEITGFTLEEIAARDPEWCGRARALIAKGHIELIGSGYAQIIGPLVPALVTEANLRIGNEIYERLLGCKPLLALVNEQAYSAGLVGLYLDAGYRALLMDWDNPAAHHPEWPAETRYLPQRALGSDGRSIALLWTSTVAFQKLQRFVHGDMLLDEYLDYIGGRRGSRPRALCLYASDAEIFDFRPGRYKTEEAISNVSEWKRFAEALSAIRAEPGCGFVAPGKILELAAVEGANLSLRLESADCPVPVKKQRKYSLARWAVTGRDDVSVNAACERICRGLVEQNAEEPAWKELCYLWSKKRWTAFCERLARSERQWTAVPVEPSRRPDDAEIIALRHIDVTTQCLSATLDRRRGLAIQRLTFAGDCRAVIGGLPHGHFDDIALQADWYTGDCVFEAPGEHKVTDLEWCEARRWRSPDGDEFASARVETSRGSIEKIMRFHAKEPRVDRQGAESRF
ncbi:MAG: glycoside hydrolase family 57 [Rhizomicrobium sp.]